MKKEFLSGAGYTVVYMVVNMNQFIAPNDHKRFEMIRGTGAFASIIRNEWESLLRSSDAPFVKEDQFIRPSKNEPIAEQRMDVDDVAFNTGIFKGVVLREFSAPFYRVDKSGFEFDPILKRNLQFKKLFLKNWEKWDIHVRPTMTGMFVIRLTNYHDHRYGTQAAEFRTISSNVQSLQSSFDIPSALEQENRLLFKINMGEDTQEAEDDLDSVSGLLEWLGVETGEATRTIEYPRIQWQLAQEVCLRFTQSIGSAIILPHLASIEWCKPEKNITSSLNDSFTVYHFNDLFAPGRLIERPEWDQQKWKDSWDQTFTINYRHLEGSPRIREAIAQLIEGAMLKQQPSDNIEGQPQKDTRRFPPQNKDKVDEIFQSNFSTWSDELCLLTPRCAVIWPSKNARKDYIYISTLPTTTSKVKYVWYWGAMERMIEFIVEIKLLASLVELESVEALNRFSRTLNRMRRELLEEKPALRRQELAILAEDATNLSRLVGMSRRLSTAQTWSRAEYSAVKATYFMQQLNIPLLIQHAETNVDNMTNLINHQDELYLASLAERNNKSNRTLTRNLFIASLALLIYTLPSFWVDSNGLFAENLAYITLPTTIDRTSVPYFTYWLGNIGALGIILGLMITGIIRLFSRTSDV